MEATMTLPITILIIVSLIGLMLTLYHQLFVQTEEHQIAIEEMYLERDMDTIRLYDRWVDEYLE